MSATSSDAFERQAPACELALADAGRALDAQERAVNELRSRAGTLIAAAAIAASFFGGGTFASTRAGAELSIATVAFAVVSAAVLIALWPRHDWEFGARATDLISAYVEPDPLPLALTHRDLALHRARSRARNAAQLRWLFRSFRLGLVALLVEVGAWLAALAERTEPGVMAKSKATDPPKPSLPQPIKPSPMVGESSVRPEPSR
jgi:hypothetical protein